MLAPMATAAPPRRYDNQKMSRLMDVVGDGKDVVRMCIDATKFSNLGAY